jgi:hypothetical protein
MNSEVVLCGHDQCRLAAGHSGRHNRYPSSAWDFFADKDKKKIGKAGFPNNTLRLRISLKMSSCKNQLL